VIEPFRALHPDKKEVSFVSFRRGGDGINIGKSRLDFFLISTNLMNIINKVYYEERISSDFDHKEVVMYIGKKFPRGKISIFNSTLDDPSADNLGKLSIYETLSIHLQNPDLALTGIIGSIDRKMVETRELIELENKFGTNERRMQRIENLSREIDDMFRDLPRIEDILDLEFSCDKRTLYEVVTLGIKNKLVGLQSFITKQGKLFREELIRKILEYEERFGGDSPQVEICKERLTRYDDDRLKLSAGRYAEFLAKNNEKPTAAFCLLGRENNVADDVSQIRGENGVKFNNSKERGEHIRKFYEGLYKKKLDALISIEDFLTRDVANSDWIQGRKLSEVEKNSMEIPITMEELTESLEKSNLKSTSGWDGISYRVISKYWPLIGKLTMQMANEIFERGELPATYKLGLVKLIPKKGDAEKVSDWRPITLLSCGYKLISGVLASRIEKWLGKLIGRAQKGFLKTKNIGTVIMNTIDSISESWAETEPMGVLCVDFVKAFDSVEHAFIKKVLEFFYFGEGMVSKIMILLHDRKARVILEEGCGESFQVERGTPQGDRISPYIFILCIEILLIKIESMDGQGIDKCNFVSRVIGGRELSTNTAESYADDLTLLFKFREGSMRIILQTLHSFYLMSGLEVNTKKNTVNDNWNGYSIGGKQN